MKKIVYLPCLTLVLISLAVAAQNDPNPNSPSPVLVAGSESDRLLLRGNALTFRQQQSRELQVLYPSANEWVTAFIRNVQPMESEGANSIRIFLKQRSGKTFELDIRDLQRRSKDEFAITFRIFDRSGYRGQPVADGDSLIYVTWRGNASNPLKIGLGGTGGIEIPKAPETAGVASNNAEYVGYHFAGDRQRFAEQAAFGPSPMLDLRLRRVGLRTWLAEQFDTPYPTFAYPDPPQSPTNPPSDCSLSTFPTCYRERYTMIPLQKWFFTEALYGEAQLRHRTAWSLSQIWVTSGLTVQQSSHAIAYHRVLSRNAFGNYRQLMYEMTLNPAMGHYLDMVRSTRTNPNENYPREILQLFSIGLYELNPDGTRRLDQNGQPIPTYDQATVNEFTKVFTGWTYCNITCQNSSPGIVNYKDPMILNPANHDLSAKTLLQYPGAPNPVIPACTNCTDPEQIRNYAEQSLSMALDNIFNHPNLGPFIGRLMIQQMVTSDPSPAYVQRVGAVFNGEAGQPRGDMKALLRAILLDPEARGDSKSDPRYGKLREPVQLITNLARIFPAVDFNGENRSDGALASYANLMGQNPFNSPTVFNYYSPDYNVPGTSILAPEFELLNTNTSTRRTNFLHTLIFDGLTPNATDSLRGTSLTFTEFLPLAEADPTGTLLLDGLNARMMHGRMSIAQRDIILQAVTAVPSSNPMLRIKTAVYLIAVSSAYQIQR